MHAPASVCRMSDLGGELDALASRTGFSGVVRIDQSDRIELARPYGLAHRGFEIPNAVDTRFGLASGAKGFTALAVVSAHANASARTLLRCLIYFPLSPIGRNSSALRQTNAINTSDFNYRICI